MNFSAHNQLLDLKLDHTNYIEVIMNKKIMDWSQSFVKKVSQQL